MDDFIVKLEENSSETVDFSRWFMPEELTALYHTPMYESLTKPQRLRYNQLHALYFNEQTMFFERALARNVLGFFLSRPLSDDLKAGLRQFEAEEEQHSEMFRRLNLKCAPEMYAQQDFHFIQVPATAGGILDFISKHPNWFPLLLWLMHLQEERSLASGKSFLKFADVLEPHFVAVQRKHLADEIRHVRWDQELLDCVWQKTGILLRQINSRMLGWMIDEYFTTPKRSAVRVVAALVRDFPDLRPQYPEFCRALHRLGSDPDYRCSFYCKSNVPNTFRMFDAWPEFRSLTKAMPGYIPGSNAST